MKLVLTPQPACSSSTLFKTLTLRSSKCLTVEIRQFREKRGEYREEQGCGPFGYFAIAVLNHHGSDNSEKEGLV